MPDSSLLVLEDGSVFEGTPFGAPVSTMGEVVFNTSMTGYQEVLTDPSYAGQIVMLTYPLVGNYGINPNDFESRRIQVRGLVVRQHCDRPSHWESTQTLHEFLESNGVPGISGIDTRAVTRRLRSGGVLMGGISRDSREAALRNLRGGPRYDGTDFVAGVSTDEAYAWGEPPANLSQGKPLNIVVVDYGVKRNIMRILAGMGGTVTALPCRASATEILDRKPDGVVFSPGPGDPALLGYAIETAKGLLGRVPVLGICLGHQVLAQAAGGRTYKLKFGHRGGNHPVRDIESGAVHITAQNHGYAVDADSLPRGVEVSHVNLNDGTVEGIRHRELPMLSIQYHSEASPGPMDNVYMFERFLAMARGGS